MSSTHTLPPFFKLELDKFNLICAFCAFLRAYQDCRLNICGCRSPRRRRYKPYEPEASHRIFKKGTRMNTEYTDINASIIIGKEAPTL